MFTGIIQRKGIVKRVSRGAGLVLEIAFEPWERALEKGESVAVDGVCLTVAAFGETRFTADVLKETEERSRLGDLIPGEEVNLERALRAGDSMGGHIVQGHVDTVGTVLEKIPRGRDVRLKIRCGRVLAAESVVKGSVAVDGVSLTITETGEDFLSVDIVPTTLRDTILGSKKPGDRVNLEGEILGKYAAKAVKGPGLTEEKLAAAGFI